MSTKQQIIDTVYNDLRRVKPHANYPRPLVEHNIAKAWNQILYDAFRKDLSFFGFYAKLYEAIAVTLDASTGVYVSTLPVAIVQLPDKSAGVRRVSPATTTGLKFAPLSEDLMELKDNLEVGRVASSTIGYVVRYDRVEYDSNMTVAIAAAGVKMSLVVPFDVYGRTENLPIPSGKDKDLVALALQFMLIQEQQ